MCVRLEEREESGRPPPASRPRAALRDRFVALLAAYWEAAFEREWARLEPQLAETVAATGRELADHGLYAFLAGLSPRLRVEPRGLGFGIDVPHDHEVDLVAEDESVALVPSAYVWPHVRVNCDPRP